MPRPSLADYTLTARNEHMRLFASIAIDQGLRSVRDLAKRVGYDHKSTLDHMHAKCLKPATTEVYATRLDVRLDDGGVQVRLRSNRVKLGPDYLTTADLLRYFHTLLRAVALTDRQRDFLETHQRIVAGFERASARTQRKALHLFAETADGLSSEMDVQRAVVDACAAVGLRLEVHREPPKFSPINSQLHELGLDAQGQQAVFETIRNELRRDPAVVRRSQHDAALQPGSFWYALTGRDGDERLQLAGTLLVLMPPLDGRPLPLPVSET